MVFGWIAAAVVAVAAVASIWPRDGGWGSWSSWSSGCYSGYHTRYRKCDNPCPRNGGDYCEGPSEDHLDCDECVIYYPKCTNGVCENIPGSYNCRCIFGYELHESDRDLCVRKKCASLRKPSEGSMRCSSSSPSHLDYCEFGCNVGYKLEGSQTRLCKNGKWTGNKATCAVKYCNRLVKPENGEVSSNCKARSPHNTKCQYSCEEGFVYTKSSLAICNDGIWTNDAVGGRCRDIQPPSFGESCPSDQTVFNDLGRRYATVKWSSVKVEDNSGVPALEVLPNVKSPHMFYEGRHTVTYTARDLAGNMKRCVFTVTVQVVTCSVLLPPPNGKYEGGACGNLHGDTCHLSCNKGYEMRGSSERKCTMKEGTSEAYWAGNETKCEAFRCSPLETPENILQTGHGCGSKASNHSATTCSFECKPGYESAGGSPHRTCARNNTWTGSKLKCEAITCPALTIKSEGLEIEPLFCANSTSEIPYATVCHFTCKSGYQLQGPGLKTCHQSKIWKPLENPSCIDVSEPVFINCSNDIHRNADRGKKSTQVTWSLPLAKDNSGLTPNITHFGKELGDIFFAGEHTIRYLASDNSGNVAECIFKVYVSVLRCPKLYAPPGGTMNCSETDQYGSECNFKCNAGHIMKGSAIRICEKSSIKSVGYWSGNETKCELAKCPPPTSANNTMQSGCGSGSKINVFGDKCLFYCAVGYLPINGSKERICQANGTWSGDLLHCRDARCKSLQDPDDGAVTPQSCKASPKYDTTCRFECNDGYKLSGERIATCLSEEQWSKNISVNCEDFESPTYGSTCPSDIKKYADRSKNYTSVTWLPVVATDNSGKTPDVTSVGVQNEYYKGTYSIVYNATDEAGNYKICKFHVTVEVLLCQTLLAPMNGFFEEECDNTYGSACRMGCDEGYNLLGSQVLSCLHKPGHLTGYWNGTVPVCKVRRCTSQSAPEHGYIYPHMCTSMPVSGTVCTFRCKPGYQSNGGATRMICNNDGKWNQSDSLVLECRDVQPPMFIRCPTDIQRSIGVNSTTLVNWTEPVAVDNSGLPPNMSVYPHGISSPYIFNGTTSVVYTATDASGNSQKCSFQVILQDDQGPVVVFCPSDQHIITTNMETVVKWNDPQFEDNSNNPLLISCSHKSGTKFYWGTWNIFCAAYDNNPSNDPAVCKFTVVVKPKDCDDLTPPKNGARACDDWMFGRFCLPFCNNQTDFSESVPRNQMWVCGTDGIWKPTNYLPDCTKVYRPGDVRMAAGLHYFYGDCNEPEVQAQIKENFIKLLNESYFNKICQDPSLRDKCTADNVNVTCGETTITRRRRALAYEDHHNRNRRSIPLTKISFEIVVNLDAIKGTGNTKESEILVGEEGIQIAKNLSSEIKRGINNGSLTLTINGTMLLPDNQSFSISEPTPSCRKGQILRKNTCLNCIAGTYFTKDAGTCKDCPVGSFQELEAQETCITCPPGTSTAAAKTANNSDCLAICKAGSYSSTGLAPCIPCDKGYYQEMEGQKSCLKCGVNQSTTVLGSNSSLQCGVPCTPGSLSPNGLEPCTLCDRRSFQPRSESRVCFSCPGTTTTQKLGSTREQDCIEIDECKSNPCQHNSSCTDLIHDFFCVCGMGFTGKQCETDIDDCQDQPCFNNGTCYDFVNNYSCSCEQGFQGHNCEEDVNECVLSPCANNASCRNLPGSYECQCDPGYTGRLCDIDIDECLRSPCQNGAICKDKVNSYECTCLEGYRGDNCEENVDDCVNNSCKNGGKCVDAINSYHCVCPLGFNGTFCEHNIDDCDKVECRNNASCVDQVNGYLCICKAGFSGKNCEVDLDECTSKPCQNEATCVDLINGYYCDCRDGFDGLQCENNIDECATNPCSNNGLCQDGINGFTCLCSPGFTGKICNFDIDFCASIPCYNNGSCFDGVSSFTCQCADGFEGKQCQLNVDDCKINPCINNSTCFDGLNEYTCACLDGFVGINCEIDIDDCKKYPCVNDGVCTDLINGYHCACRSGYTGTNCSVNIDDCADFPCRNNATCLDKVDNYTCSCLDGFSGTNCEVNVDDCQQNLCVDGSTCMDGINSYSCDCAPGYMGDHCELEIDECASFPCLYGGTCRDQINGFVCICPTGFNGTQCEENIDDCKVAPCFNNGTCSDLVANYSCLCPVGFDGLHCEHRIDYCIDANCSQNGLCVSSLRGFFCDCTSGYYGKYCEFETDECLAKPCLNDASCHDVVNNFTCSCPDGYTGRFCELDIDDCLQNSCLNNATCVDHTLGYTCLCSQGYNGTYCEAEIDSCLPNPCINNGTCVDLTHGYECQCLERFYGKNCENMTNICSSYPCLNGGTCKANNSSSEFLCLCGEGFNGTTCEIDIDECLSNPCMPNAQCIDMANSYQCKCDPSYSGDHCEIFFGSNFDLVFNRKSADDLVLLTDGEGIPNMRYVTITMFVRIDVTCKSGTLFTYSVPENSQEIIVISFTESQVHLQIKDEMVTVDFKLSDDHWHYLGVTWIGIIGNVSVYIDGPERKSVSNIKVGSKIRGGGWIALGRRYPVENTSPTASLMGRLHQVNFWDLPLNSNHMWNAAHNCTWPVEGNLRAWSNFLVGVKGQVEKKFKTQCKALDDCSNCSHFQQCETRHGLFYCICVEGFTGPFCDINIDDCDPNPCVHGKCIDNIAGFDCVCEKQYWGVNCDKKIITEKECPELNEPENGKKSCRRVSGRMLCVMSCNEGRSFDAEAVNEFLCGPDTKWKWNSMDKITVPTCLRMAAPKEIEHHFSIKFSGIQCSKVQREKEFRSALEEGINGVLSPVTGCQSCRVKKMAVPECKSRTSRAAKIYIEVLFSFVIKNGEGSSSSGGSIEEISEAVLFQMNYAVATGQFRLYLDGLNSTADRSSFNLVYSNVTCNLGFVTTSDRKRCGACPLGTLYDINSSKCSLCNPGSYQDKEGQTTCTLCNDGKWTSAPGATSKGDCQGEVFSTRFPDQSEDTSFLLYILVSVLSICFLAAIFVGCRLCRCFCFAQRVVGVEKRSYSPEEKEPVSHSNLAYGEFPLGVVSFHIPPQTGKEKDTSSSGIPDRVSNIYVSND